MLQEIGNKMDSLITRLAFGIIGILLFIGMCGMP